MRSGDFAPVERDEPAIDPPAVGEVEADAPGRLLQLRLVAATAQFVEELRGRIGHLGRLLEGFRHPDEGPTNGDRSPGPASERTSPITTLSAAVTGNAMSAPASPARLDPISNTMMTSGAERSILRHGPASAAGGDWSSTA